MLSDRKDAPERVEEHLVAGRTRNTACGAQRTTSMSSGVKAFEGCESTSSSIDFAIAIWVGAPGFAASAGRAI